MSADTSPGIVDRVPLHLYKYKSFAGEAREHTRDLIVNQRLWFPAPRDLNDPFECRPHHVTTATPRERRRYIVGLVKRGHPTMPRHERKRRVRLLDADNPLFHQSMLSATEITLQAAGIFSLSARPLDLLMWTHYADNHRGVCVRFDLPALVESDHIPFRVTYADERPSCDTILEPTVDWLLKAVLTKGAAWRYEQEWRLVRNRGARQAVQLSKPVISGVLLGANVSPGDREAVLQWAAESGRPVGVGQVKFHPSRYELVIEELEPR